MTYKELYFTVKEETGETYADILLRNIMDCNECHDWEEEVKKETLIELEIFLGGRKYENLQSNTLQKTWEIRRKILGRRK